ncbi:metallophosphoesterase [Actinoplanes hulinensis]|uniref:Metallophosphoesterase n=1 Tax=Actinoplanes hulinensis TaxID=1144547 RepID=A0ABS7B5U0_9ACTN|nr:metallophosphoesterase [Actinoplanes hulinensis]MBW6436293.1 metallophosphoesterase [Actinoplanes hulinensis]
MPPLFAASDMHGHRTEFRDALHEAGLIDAAGDWCGADARLWLLGDYFDRGPDGLGIVDDIRRLNAQSGGNVRALLGNHEVFLLAAHRFGTDPVPGWPLSEGGYYGAWRLYGGRENDLRGLTPDHLGWLATLPALTVADDHLLTHCDSTAYLEFGATLTAVNDHVIGALASSDPYIWLHLWSRFCGRGDLRSPAAVDKLLSAYGGSAIVHGHSTLLSHFGLTPAQAVSAHRYTGGRVIAIDGGVFEGGRILVTRLT